VAGAGGTYIRSAAAFLLNFHGAERRGADPGGKYEHGTFNLVAVGSSPTRLTIAAPQASAGVQPPVR